MDIQLLGNIEIHGADRTVRLPRSGERCVAVGRPDNAREVWQEALEVWLANKRDTDADRIRCDLAELTRRKSEAAQPAH